MKNIRVKGYQFDELDSTAQDKAISEAVKKLPTITNPIQTRLEIIGKFRAMETHFLPSGCILK